MAKIKDVARLLVLLAQERDGDLMTQLRLQKMLFFVQGWHLARHGVPLFDAPIQAWELGPVSTEIRSEYFQCKNQGIEIPEDEKENVQLAEISKLELETILDVFNEYDKYSTGTLVNMTHMSEPWKKHYDKATKCHVIPVDDIRDFFSKQPKLSGMDEILAGYPTEIVE